MTENSDKTSNAPAWRKHLNKLALTGAVGLGTFGLLSSSNMMPPPAAVSVQELEARATDFIPKLVAAGQRVPPAMQRIAALETQMDQTSDEAIIAELVLQVRYEQYFGIRNKELPPEFQDAVIKEVGWRKLEAQKLADSAGLKADTIDKLGNALNQTRVITGIPFPTVSGQSYTLAEMAAIGQIHVYEAIEAAPTVASTGIRSEDSRMLRMGACSKHFLKARQAIEEINAMAEEGHLTVRVDPKARKGVQMVSNDYEDYGIPYISGPSRANAILTSIEVESPSGKKAYFTVCMDTYEMLHDVLRHHCTIQDATMAETERLRTATTNFADMCYPDYGYPK